MFSTCLSLDYLLLIYTIFFLFVGIRISPWFFDRLSHFWRYSIVCNSCLCTIHSCSKFQVRHLFFPLNLKRTFPQYSSCRKVVSVVEVWSSREAKKPSGRRVSLPLLRWSARSFGQSHCQMSTAVVVHLSKTSILKALETCLTSVIF